MCSRCEEKQGKSINELELGQELSNFLEETQYSHLCSSCTTTLNELVNKSVAHPFPKPGGEIEGVHYTLENGLLVFTEYYHISRGYCCENNCRNCAYGFRLRA